jgi:hypothetical protein
MPRAVVGTPDEVQELLNQVVLLDETKAELTRHVNTCPSSRRQGDRHAPGQEQPPEQRAPLVDDHAVQSAKGATCLFHQ